MNEMIIQTLAPLNIPVAFMEYQGKASAYAMFQIYNEADSNYEDDEASAEVSYITIAYWYQSPADEGKAKQIKDLMKANGFIFDGAKTLKDGTFYGKTFDFIYKKYL